MDFDLTLSIECANSYATSTGLGCIVSDLSGQVLHSVGMSCKSCTLCSVLGKDIVDCGNAQAYGMTEAERFGGKYIYFCPLGLTCFVSPILGTSGSEAKITVGPFLMVELEDFIAYELEERLKLEDSEIQRITKEMDKIPFVPTERVNALSNLLFMSVGFMNNVNEVNRMLENQSSEMIQGQITEYILELKQGSYATKYPYDLERELMNSIADSNKKKSQQILNEILGHILFSSGGNFSRIKTQIYELLVVISRAASDAGASPEKASQLTHDYFIMMQNVQNVEELCYKLTKVMNSLIDIVFSFNSTKNVDVMHKTIHFLRQNYREKITLDQVASMVHLSSSYFGKIFKKETGYNFNTYLNAIRIEKSKKLLLYEDISLVSIAGMVGFEDQSYFTKVFKRTVGISPKQFRKTGGRNIK